MSILSELSSPSFLEELFSDEESDHGDHLSGPTAVVPNPVPMLGSDVSLESPTISIELESVELNEPSDGTLVSAVLVTIFPDSQDPIWLLPSTYDVLEEYLQHWCGQFEICPDTGNLHAHIFIKFTHKNRMRFNKLRQLFSSKLNKGCDLKSVRPSVKNVQQVINYCLKPDKGAIAGTQYILTTGPCVKKTQFNEDMYFNRSKVSKADAKKKSIIDYLETKPWHLNWDQIVHESSDSKLLLADCGWGKKYHEGRKVEQPRRSIEQVVLLFGAAGTGKTTMAFSFGREYDLPDDLGLYVRNFEEDKFWGSGKTAYNNHPCILCEEFKGQETFSKLKQITDIGKPGPAVAVKGSGTFLNHQQVIFASNYHPAAWYRNMWNKDPVHWKAFHRRVTKVLFFPDHHPDGELNRPGTPGQTDPYFVDMTDEFKTDMVEYEDAWHAFQSVWPTHEEESEEANGQNLWIPEAKRQRR